MTDEILPIDREVLEEQTKEIELEKKQKNTAPPIEEPEEEIDNDTEGADPVVVRRKTKKYGTSYRKTQSRGNR